MVLKEWPQAREKTLSMRIENRTVVIPKLQSLREILGRALGFTRMGA